MKNENNIYGYVRVSSIERLGRDYEKGAVAPKTATNPMAEIHALHGIAAIVF